MISTDAEQPPVRGVRAPTVGTGRSSGARALAGIAVIALVLGLAIGRFATYRPTASQAAAPAPAAVVSLDDRMTELERRVERDPRDLSGWQALGVTAVQRAAETGDPAFYDLAERALDRADEVVDAAPQTLVARGSLALSLHDFDAALRIGRQAVDSLPANGQALGIVVDAQVELGRYDEAAQTLQEMLDVRPDLPALARVSYLRQLHGDLAGAQQAMRQAALAGSPLPFDQATVAALEGDLHLVGNDVAAAAEAYQRALELSPGLVPATVGMARVEAIRGDVAGAQGRLTQLVERIPHPEAAALLVELQTASGNPAARDTAAVVRSLAALQQAQGQVVDLEMALFEADQGEHPQRAVQLARAAHEARPDNVFTADALGWALHRAGETRQAVQFAEQATRLGTADPLLRYHAAEIHAAAGDDAVAAQHLRAALELTPWFSFTAIPDARRLAQRLDVAVPQEWRQR